MLIWRNIVNDLLLCVSCLIKAEGWSWKNKWMEWTRGSGDALFFWICFSEEPLDQRMELSSAIKHPHVTSLHLEVMVKSSARLREWLSAGRAPDNHTLAAIVSVTLQGFMRAWIALSERAAVRSVADLQLYWSVWGSTANCCVGWSSAVKEHSVNASCRTCYVEMLSNGSEVIL